MGSFIPINIDHNQSQKSLQSYFLSDKFVQVNCGESWQAQTPAFYSPSTGWPHTKLIKTNIRRDLKVEKGKDQQFMPRPIAKWTFY